MDPETRPPPRAAELIPIVPIVLLVVVAVRQTSDRWLTDTTTVAGLAVGSAVVVGLPGAFWVLDHRYTRWHPFAVVGALCGALIPLCLLASAFVGFTARFGVAYARWALARRASLPVYGSVSWGEFAGIEATAAIIGAASGTIFWLVRTKGQRSPARSSAAILLVVIAAMAAAFGARKALGG